MVPWRATDDGLVTKQNLDWYRRFAQARPAVLVVEATCVRDIPRVPLRVGDDRFLPCLRQHDVVKERRRRDVPLSRLSISSPSNGDLKREVL